ncbi:dynein light chain [Toxoplasma gondii RUB]|uniref:Dynein light chain n=7 Tax=Toxoplasma gondii TaxID=5811 RepID=B9PRY1_TOXGO|nr:dynein light chain 8d [Toxoplasma gondii]EPR63233.1 dynein light chain [Toxoplasma gondii GT1]KFG34411.1 dynein light chain [Toxoplasma gondii GAB2-2007-GAL-DOM2]KFG45903.1 dynein light chain [Toxoplasma gondii FOU]KFG58609.1 dynein light chain [Toxoplasma gondii RUB]KFH09358.1 dynein light chain [Toxoplasma gondii VAND]RQX70322.1 dynein light chain [Toxoplasma gondii CAST]
MGESATSREFQLPAVVAKGVDMSRERAAFAVEAAKKGYIALLKNDLKYWQEAAQMLKEEFDASFGGSWHVIVGQHFGAYVTHEAKQMIYIAIGPVHFLIYRHG